MPITVDHATVYDPQHHNQILRDISCTLEDKHVTLLLGRTGAGKSTLLDALSGLIKIDAGTVLYDQSALWQGKRLNSAVQFSLGNVFQYPEQQLFARTVKGEFDYSLHPLKLGKVEFQKRTMTALHEMGLSPQIMPESPLILSGGQKRRVALACTLATQPTWLFLDEPTAGLDPETTQKFLAYLSSWKQREASGGVVVATHDLEAFLPVADAIIVMHQGRILAHVTPRELCLNPRVLIEAEIGIPASIELAMLLHQQGIAVADGPLSPRQYADYLLHKIHGHATPLTINEGNINSALPIDSSTREIYPQTYQEASSREAREKFVSTLDPRAKWLFYLLISIGILMQTHVVGLILGSMVCVATVFLTRVPPREIAPVIKPFVLLTILSVLLSGLRFGNAPTQWHLGTVYFSLQAALLTFMQLYKILLVMILGVLLPATTSQLKMKKGLERSLAVLQRLRLPVEAFSLGASLLLHFIPVIMKEMQRFSRITRARGKRPTKIGTVRIRDVSALVIPLVLSVLQLGSDLALAMEARGYTHMGLKRTASYDLKLQRADVWIIFLSLIVFALLWSGQMFPA